MSLKAFKTLALIKYSSATTRHSDRNKMLIYTVMCYRSLKTDPHIKETLYFDYCASSLMYLVSGFMLYRCTLDPEASRLTGQKETCAVPLTAVTVNNAVSSNDRHISQRRDIRY